MAKGFHDFLGRVEHGESVRTRKHGKAVARLVPDCDFMPGDRAAALFKGHQGDEATAAAVTEQIARLDAEGADALAH